ncbi:MAG: c-type cytochrome [Pedosphaera sp.]|nr:c-type cytochrome [Pedosphaera sp.]
MLNKLNLCLFPQRHAEIPTAERSVHAASVSSFNSSLKQDWWSKRPESRASIPLALTLIILTAAHSLAQSGDKPGEEQPALALNLVIPPAPPLPPAEALKTFHLQAGFHIELVAAEPLVRMPVAMQFDTRGRIWVVEMCGYMPDADGVGEDQPVGRIVVLEDTNGDGRMDKSTVFIDGLVMPRALCLVRDGILIAEPPHLWFCRDINGDGRSDEKIEVANDYATQNDPKLGKNSNPELGANGLMLAMDNWIYSPYHGYRYRHRDGRWSRESTLASRGQWGISQDNCGRLFFNSNTDQLRGDLVQYDYVSRNMNYSAAGSNVQIARDQSVWPLRLTTGVNRGYQKGILRDGKLAEFTAACGPVIYRGDNFPSEFQGNAFVAEPAGNLIHRNILLERDGIVTATNAYHQAEFLASTDERFRPVNLYNGPDGALYVVDFYHGIIQHRIYMTSFLRKQVEHRGLHAPNNMGRIYRVLHDGGPRTTAAPRLHGAGTDELVKALSHSNGWQRDTAQQLLVERSDASSILKLRRLALSGTNELGRLHALWTLQGLARLDESTVLSSFKDTSAKVRCAAIRLSEPFVRRNPVVADRLRALLQDLDTAVQLQLALSLGEIRDDASLATIASKHSSHLYIRDAVISGLAGRELEFIQRLLKDPSWSEASEGRVTFLESLAKAVFNERNTTRVNRLLEIAATQDISSAWRQVALLDGVLGTFPPPPKDKPDQQPRPAKLDAEPAALAGLQKIPAPETRSRVEKLAALLTWPGKPEPAAAPTVIAVAPLTPEQQKRFDAGKELYIITCGACHQPHGDGQDGLAPPLRDSDWAIGSEQRTVRIALNGVRGPINVKGKTYELEMPGMGVLDDEQISSILTYIRREWSHTASAIDPSTIATIRKATEKREESWTQPELLRIP